MIKTAVANILSFCCRVCLAFCDNAVVGFHDALRKELGPDGIRVSLIEPGSVWTEWGHNVPEEAMRERRKSVDALTAEDVAQALVYSFAQHPRVLVERSSSGRSSRSRLSNRPASAMLSRMS